MNTIIDTARSRPHVSVVLVLVLSLGTLAGCGPKEDSAVQQEAEAAGEADAAHGSTEAEPHSRAATDRMTGTDVSLAGVTFTPPQAWRDLGPSGMRKAQFELPPRQGDTEAAEVNVYYFGPDAGGGIEANLQRWVGQMSRSDGGDAAAAAERSTFEVEDMTAHMVAVDGSYDPGMGRPMGGGGEPKEGYRLVGVVLEAPQGNVFFKLTGPQATARAMEGELLAMVRGATKTG